MKQGTAQGGPVSTAPGSVRQDRPARRPFSVYTSRSGKIATLLLGGVILLWSADAFVRSAENKQKTFTTFTDVTRKAGLWQDGGHAPPFDLYETRRLRLLLNIVSNGNSGSWPDLPAYSKANPNNSAPISVLAALAHELGHVLWYESFVPVRGGPFSRLNFCQGFYSRNSWNNIDIPPKRWIEFGQQINTETHNPDYVTKLKRDLNPPPTPYDRRILPDFPQTGEDLHALLQDKSLPGVLAAFNPDEDFVETYVLYVLLNAVDSSGVPQFRNMEITIKGTGTHRYKDDVPGSVRSRYDLLRKMSCFGPLPFLP